MRKSSIFGCVVLLLLSACGQDAPKNQLTIGSLVPRSGNNANADWITVAQLAVDEMNDALLALGNPKQIAINWESRDSASSPALMRKYARELVDLGAKILTAEDSASAHGNAENYGPEPLQTAIVCASCTSPDINRPDYRNADPLVEAAFRDPGNWLFRTAGSLQNHDAILTRKMAAYGDRGDTNGDGFVKVVVICTTDTDCISTQSPADVAKSRRSALDVLTANLPNPGCNTACAGLSPARLAAECPAVCDANPECRFHPVIETCAPKRIVFESLLIDQYTSANSADWSDLMARVFDTQSQQDTFTLEPGTSSQSASARGSISALATAPDPPGCLAPDFIWNKALPVPALSLVKAYSLGEYPAKSPTTKFMNHDPFHRNFIRLALGDSGNGQEGVAILPWDRSPSGEHFIRAQRERTGNLPTSFDAQYYDAVVLAMLATLKAALPLEDPTAVTGAQVRDALLTLNQPGGIPIATGPGELASAVELIMSGEAIDYHGASGRCDLTAPSASDSGGNVGPAEAVYWRMENGQFSYKEVYDCRQSADNCPITVLGP